MPINWNNIRPLNNSLNDGFEELVCQLAAKEPINNKKTFRRIGKPDGGKECYWELDDGSQYMWQAKYFTTSPGPAQWAQIDESVKAVIGNHPKLKKYYICLPLDMPDAKVGGKTSMLDKWKAKIKEWQQYANTKAISIEFEYWGSNELITRLSQKELEGLSYFWFNQEEFSDAWFENKNAESIAGLGARYTKELNFNLPVSKVFDGLSRDKGFEIQIHNYYKGFLEKSRNLRFAVDNVEIQELLINLSGAVQHFREIYEPFPFIGNEKIPIETYSAALSNCLAILGKIDTILYRLRNEVEKEKGIKDHYGRPYSNEMNNMYSFRSSAHDFNKFLQSNTCRLANQPFLIVTGSAGVGKSHLLADIIWKRREINQQSLLLLGENFSTEEMPWTQVLHNQLRKTSLDEFVLLGSLNAKAQSQQSRIIIFIDALNEGNGRKIWPKRLKAFIQSIAKYEWLGLVISIRSSFEGLIAPENEIDGTLASRLKHTGFAGNEYEAVKLFFRHYNIVQPATPILNPEFQNPLFLKLFCKSLYERGLSKIPEGYEGITNIINFFLESVNIKLSSPDHLYFDSRKPIVKSVVEKLLFNMIENEADFVPYLLAEEIASSEFSGCANPEPYLKRLISEGVLNEDLHWDEQGKPYDIVYFAYQRFQDHLTVSLMLDKYLNLENPDSSFITGKLNDLVKDEYTANMNQNLIEALSIQVPERINKELFEIVPHAKKYDSIARGFIESLLWRKSGKISECSRRYVNEVVLNDSYLLNHFLETTLLCSMKSGFYFNANSLHAFLMKFSLQQRDLIWTTWLQDKYEELNENASAVKRLIDYAWNENDHTHLSEDSLLLGCITLGWFLTSCNRYLRDAATKALVSLMQDRLNLIIKLLDKFKKVNDSYVLERLYAAAYGAVLRSGSRANLATVSEYIYEEIFNKEEVYPHILLRDYARGIIEYTLHLKYRPKVDIVKVRPPYKSKKLPSKFPSNAEIDKRYKPKKDTGNYSNANWGATAILMSMTTEYGRGVMSYGDFGRYTFQAALYDWKVDCNKLSNYAVQRIFEIGYDPEIFTEFDIQQGSGREGGQKERIGKKYQWVIFYELLARVSDHCLLADESSWHGEKKYIAYDGPWYPYVRDIDPSMLIKETKAEKYRDGYTDHWWFNTVYQPWDIEEDAWIIDKKDLPLPESILEVTDKEGDLWLWLEVHPDWGEKEALGAGRYDTVRKLLWYQMRSYLIPKSELPLFQEYFNRDFHRGELPEARNMYTIFDKEYYWSPAFKFFDKPYYGGEDSVRFNAKSDGKYVTSLRRTTEFFNWEEEYDCSKTSAIQFYKPTKFVHDQLGLYKSKREGEFLDNAGNLACFDPSVHQNSIGGLLVRKEMLIEMLEREGLAMVWSVIGEKQFLGRDRVGKNGPNRLNLSGLYILERDGITGSCKYEEE